MPRSQNVQQRRDNERDWNEAAGWAEEVTSPMNCFREKLASSLYIYWLWSSASERSCSVRSSVRQDSFARGSLIPLRYEAWNLTLLCEVSSTSSRWFSPEFPPGRPGESSLMWGEVAPGWKKKRERGKISELLNVRQTMIDKLGDSGEPIGLLSLTGFTFTHYCWLFLLCREDNFSLMQCDTFFWQTRFGI